MLAATDILYLTDGGRQVFEREIPNFTTSRNIKSPLRFGDDCPSFRIKRSNNGIYYAKDHGGDNFKGNAISFIMRLYSLTYGEAINKIVQDLGLTSSNRVYTKSIISDSPNISYYSEIDFTDMPFNKSHHLYFNKGGLYEDFLKDNDVFAVKKWALNKKVQAINSDEIVFAYYARDINKTKIVRIGPSVDKKDKWRTDVTRDYLWYYSNYLKNEKLENLFVNKSNKDDLVLKLLGINGISTQSENRWVIEENFPKIQKIASSIVMAMGSDEQGFNTSLYIQRKFNTKWWNTPKNVLKYGVNDAFSYSSKFGLKALENHLKQKKYL